ncbi:MAG: amidase [uncultured Paraburkholderia sp.]|uniref:amidase n=1 Tax=uncultured Paraburkholderia sp. TaxID=1822466 RepID=UPI002598293D|nr:amidase [uncultured Paraburkholderia sp.]CAH2903488.1 MAG: amidase [uncultured Paraburkholderia sp.]CAH2939970.1 MAG: amidase [uncultured Paraburkholderia sp.]
MTMFSSSSKAAPIPSISQIRAEVASGEARLEQYVTQAYEAACKSQASLHAFCYLPDAARVNAADVASPLAGVPVAVKDVIDTADMPTEFNSLAYKGRRPERDARVVARLRAAGASIIGKTVTTEFAWRKPGATVNPWNDAFTPGGSSSGSAAAVAAGIVPLALGTQTQGSVIRPAAYCGIVGFKPTYGAIARTGVLPLAWSLDHVGMFATRVADVAYALALVTGEDAVDPHVSHVRSAAHVAARGTGTRRIGVLSKQAGGAIEPAQQAALDRLAAQLARDGAEIVTVDLPAEIFETPAHALKLMSVEAAITHGELVDRTPELVSEAMRGLVEEGRKLPATVYASIKAAQMPMAHRFHDWLTGALALDALLVAPATGEPPRGLDYTGDASFCAPWTFLGVPAVTVPVGFGPQGLPLGAQLVGAAHGDADLLKLAEWVEARTGWPAAVAQRKM